MSEQNKEDKKPAKYKWLKRLGIAGFLFFFIKGLAWIGVALFVWLGLCN